MNHKLDCTAFVGVDWGDQEHAYCILAADGSAVARGTLKQTPEAIAVWATQLRRQFGGRPVAVCLEQSRGALIFALMQYDFLLLCPLNPAQLAAYRKALHPSGAKDDPTDAELIARFACNHSDQLRVWKPADEITRGLGLLSEQRREWVEQRVALENQLRQRLKETYPQALQLFPGDLHAERFLTFLAKFPTLGELQRASPRQLAKWLAPRRRRADDPPAEQLGREAAATVRQALPLTKDPAVLEHARLTIRHLQAQLELLNEAVTECDEKIAALFARHPDREVFASFPGAGATLAPRLAAAFGTDREKFHTAGDIQQISGIAPVTRSSGKTRVVQIRWACPKFLRQTFHEFARCSTKFSAWAQAYLEMRRAAGTPYQVIVRALAFKWQRIMFRCWQTRQPYDEQRYLESLRTAGSKLLRFLPPQIERNP
jgi:transposase